MNRTVLIVGSILGCSAIGILFLFDQKIGPEVPPSVATTAPRSLESQIVKSGAVRASDIAEPRGRVVKYKDSPSIKQRIADLKIPDPGIVLRDPEVWMERARGGDLVASLAIFRALENCTVFQSSVPVSTQTYNSIIIDSNLNCSKIPADQARDRLAWLRQAADNGSAVAQYIYGSSAPGINTYQRTLTPRPAAIQEIDQRAMMYLEKSAENGIVEAYGELASIYVGGILGQYSIPKAYGYAAAALELRPSQSTEKLLRSIESRARPGEINEGVSIRNSLLARWQARS